MGTGSLEGKKRRIGPTRKARRSSSPATQIDGARTDLAPLGDTKYTALRDKHIQLESDYGLLKTKYNALIANHSLLQQDMETMKRFIADVTEGMRQDSIR